MIHPDLGDPLRLHAQVSGRVQGVGFRAFVKETADSAGLTGWVRNLGYDQVEVVAEGSHEKLDWFAEQLKDGPLGARVDRVRIDWETGHGDFPGFIVRSSR